LVSGLADEAFLGGPKGINDYLFYEGEQGVVYSLGESADMRRSRWPIKTGSGEEKAEPKRQLQRGV